jgi:hypothetical protein
MHKRFCRILMAVALVLLPALSVLSPIFVRDTFAASLQIVMEYGWGSNDITAGYNPLVSSDGKWGSYHDLNFTVKVDGKTDRAIAVTTDHKEWVEDKWLDGGNNIKVTSSGFNIGIKKNVSLSNRQINFTVSVPGTSLSYTFFIQQQGVGECPYSACLIENNQYIEADAFKVVYTFSSAGNSKTYQKSGGTFEMYNDEGSACNIYISSQTSTSITITAKKNESKDECLSGLSVAGAPSLYVFSQPRYFADDGTPTPTDPIDPNNPNSNSPAPPSDCEAGKMGWALCPIIDGLDKALGGIYGWIESNFLQVDVAFYRTDDPNNPDPNAKSATYQAWGAFRNIANILFVIFFLVVILSQVTSVGISNYGIKKMLPEIIMAAILINLSYFICQAMVDLSNIVGYQIRSLLDAIITTPGAGYASVSPDGGTTGFLAVIVGVAIGAAVATTIATILSGGIFALVMGILMALLVAAVAILMMFVLLVVRQIGVIALVVLAPLAFAARILPNTQGLFKKWWSAFTALLVVYPVCGLVIGIGALASKIIGGNVQNATEGIEQGIWVIATVLAAIVPYFAVITFSKGALNGLGKLGGMITGKVSGAGAGINKLGATGLNAGKKKIDQLRGYDAKMSAKAAIAKDKADQRSAQKMAGGAGIYGKMQRSGFETEQVKDDATLANFGQYAGSDKGLQKQSRANAVRLGLYQAGNAAYDADAASGYRNLTSDAAKSAHNATDIAAHPGDYEYEIEKQRTATSVVQQQEAKLGKQFAEGYEPLDANDVTNSVMTGSTMKAGVTNIQAEQAIQALIKKKKYDQAEKLTKAYTGSALYNGADTRQRSRLASVLQSGDSKAEAATLNAYGKLVGKGSTHDYAAAEADTSVNGLNAEIQSGSYNMATQDSDTITSMMGNANLRATMLGKLTPQNITQMNTKQFNAVAPHLDDNAIAGVLGTDMSAERQTAVNTMLAGNAVKSNAVATALSAQQMNKVGTDTFATMASHSLGRVITASNLSTLSAADKAVLKTAFKSSSDAMALNPDVAKNWHPDIQNILR